MKNFLSKINKYLVDILILAGSWILFYFFIRPNCTTLYGLPSMRLDCIWTNHQTGAKMIGFILLTIGLDILIRRFIYLKNKQ